MAEEHIYRLAEPEKAPPPEIKPPPNPIKDSTPEVEKSSKIETPDRPFSASYFDVPAWGEIILNPNLDVYHLKDKSLFIDNYLSDKMAKSGMKKDSETFGKLLGELEAYLNLNKELHEPVYRITKVYNMLKTAEHANQVNENRRKFLESILSKV